MMGARSDHAGSRINKPKAQAIQGLVLPLLTTRLVDLSLIIIVVDYRKPPALEEKLALQHGRESDDAGNDVILS
jgi:hypothetical protein